MATQTLTPANDILTEAARVRRAAYAAMAALRALDDEPAPEEDGEFAAEADAWDRQLRSTRATASGKL